MRYTKLLAGSLVAIATLIGAVAASGAPAKLEVVYLNSYTANDSSGGNSVTATRSLTQGTKYLIEVQGTFSAWGAWDGSCGKPASAPMFDSPGRPITPVGDDPVFRFAEPKPATGCPTGKLPFETHLFQVNLGSGWVPFATLLGHVVPTRTHKYFGTVTGEGSAPMFRIVDWHPSDNNGEYKITIF